MTKNLVIVESPAKARTIERYLGDGYKVLASYGHVRDLPENPGKGKLGVDVEHDFAPEYVISEDRRKQLGTSAVRRPRRTSSTSPPTSTAKARPSPGTSSRPWTSRMPRRAGSRSARSPRAPSTPPSRTRATSTWTSWTLSRRAASWTAWWATRSARSSRARSAAASPPAACSRSPCAWWWSASATSRPSRPVSTGHWRPACARFATSPSRPAWSASTARPWREAARWAAVRCPSPDEATAQAYVEGLRGQTATVTSQSVRSSKRNPAPPFTTSTLQQEASRKLGFGPRRTMSVAQRLYEGIVIDGEPTGLITYMRTDSVNLATSAQHEAHDVIGERFGAEYAVKGGRGYRNRTKGAQEAHEAIRPTSFRRDPESLKGHIKEEELRLYRLIWQRALASQMAAKQLETTTAELEAGRFGLRASATRTVFDGFARVYTEGRDDEADDDAEGRLPALAEGDQAACRGRRRRAALHRAAAALHGGHAHQGPRGARHRSSLHVRRHHLDHPGARLRQGRGPPPAAGGGGRHRHGRARRALRRLRGRGLHGAHGGGARRGGPWRARVGAAAARVLRSL